MCSQGGHRIIAHFKKPSDVTTQHKKVTWNLSRIQIQMWITMVWGQLFYMFWSTTVIHGKLLKQISIIWMEEHGASKILFFSTWPSALIHVEVDFVRWPCLFVCLHQWKLTIGKEVDIYNIHLVSHFFSTNHHWCYVLLCDSHFLKLI